MDTLIKEKDELKQKFQKERDSFDATFREKSADLLKELEDYKKKVEEYQEKNKEIEVLRQEKVRFFLFFFIN